MSNEALWTRLPLSPQELASLVINLRSKQPFDDYIGRPGRGQTSLFGNPVPVTPTTPRPQAVADFEQYLLFSTKPPAQAMRAQLHTLRCRRLGCFCAPALCHGHVLALHAATLAPGQVLPEGGLLGFSVMPALEQWIAQRSAAAAQALSAQRSLF